MKPVRVRLFAAFRDAAGVETMSLESAAGSVGELFTELTRRYPGLQAEATALVAINDAMVDWDTGFAADDEVLFFPPVAGG